MSAILRFTSLRSRLLLLITAVLAITGLFTMWFASRAVEERFHTYLIQEQNASREDRQQLQSLLPVVAQTLYHHDPSLQALTGTLQQLADLSRERLVLTDQNDNVIHDTASKRADQPEFRIVNGNVIPLILNDEKVGAITILPIVSPQLSLNQQQYIAEMNSSLLWAVAGSAVLALILTLAVTRSILRPVEALTSAVRRLEQGDLHQRVEVTSDNEIGKLAHAFNNMFDGLEHIEQLRRTMVSDVAHELRTPLSNVRGYLEAMQDGVVEPTIATINSLYEEAILLQRLVDDLQLLALADAGHLPLIRQPVDVDEIIAKAIQAAQHRLTRQEIRLHLQVQPHLPAVLVDAERIGQVLRNLLNNALIYTPANGMITISAYQMGGWIQVSVYNTGQGIPAEHIPFLFERFYRADRSRTRSTGGSGLGLAIVKQLIQAHGGIVWADSVPGEFARFSFTLPVAH